LRAALQIGSSRKSVIAVGRAYAQKIKFCIEGRVAASLAPKKPYRLHRFLWPQDRRINLDPTPLNEVCGFRIEGSTTYTLRGFCGLRIVRSTWILHLSQGSVASASKDPPGSDTHHKVPQPRDRSSHLDSAPLTRFCGLGIVGFTWIVHPLQGSVASGSKDPPGSYTPHRVLWPQGRRIHLDHTPHTVL
jgi:hypothetical protein